MRLGYGLKTRRINYQLTAVVYDPSELVTRFSTHPKFVVVFIEKSDDSCEFSAGVADMDPGANLSGASERFPNFTSE
jgi:hypothetical protein